MSAMENLLRPYQHYYLVRWEIHRALRLDVFLSDCLHGDNNPGLWSGKKTLCVSGNLDLVLF